MGHPMRYKANYGYFLPQSSRAIRERKPGRRYHPQSMTFPPRQDLLDVHLNFEEGFQVVNLKAGEDDQAERF